MVKLPGFSLSNSHPHIIRNCATAVVTAIELLLINVELVVLGNGTKLSVCVAFVVPEVE